MSSLSCITADLREMYQCLPANRFNKSVDNFCDQLGADLCAANFCRVTVHARFPNSALVCHGWYRILAEVCLVVCRTLCNLLHNVYDKPQLRQ